MIAISPCLEAKFDYSYFIIFLHYGSTILHKNFQVILSKNEGMTVTFAIFDYLTKIFPKFNVQDLDIVTLLGAEGP